MASQAEIYQLADSVLSADMMGESALMNYQTGKYFGLQGAAVILLDRLRQGAGFAQLLELLVHHYQVESAVAEADLRGILQALVDVGLVQRLPAPAAP